MEYILGCLQDLVHIVMSARVALQREVHQCHIQ